MKASDLLVKCLENERVEYVFGVPGEEMLDLLDSISSSSIKFITTRHEQGAGFMAGAYGKLTGRAGVCASTLGPGAMNLATSVADANLDHSPLVAITGQVNLESTHKEYHQHIDVVQAFQPITKWNTQIDTPQIIPEVVRTAFRTAEREKPGATHLELPEDVAEQDVLGEPLPRRSLEQPAVREGMLRYAADLINRSEHPVILAGNGVIRNQATHALRDFSSFARIPASTTFMGKGTIPADSDLYMGTIGLQARDHAMCGFDRADLVIAVGYDIVEYSPSRWNPNGDKTIVHIDAIPAEVQEHYVPRVELVGDMSITLEHLVPLLDTRKSSGYHYQLQDYIESERRSHSRDTGPKLAPQKIIYDISQVLGKDDILVSDVGAHKIWIARLYPAMEPNTVLISNGFASMGYAIPTAIAAKLVHPDKKVLAACGDGGFLMSVQELETACRLGLKIIYLIINDNSYGLVRWKQARRHIREYGVDLGNPDFTRLAGAFGARGYRMSDASELEPILREAFNGASSVIIDVPVDYGENIKLTETLGHMICPT